MFLQSDWFYQTCYWIVFVLLIHRHREENWCIRVNAGNQSPPKVSKGNTVFRLQLHYMYAESTSGKSNQLMIFVALSFSFPRIVHSSGTWVLNTLYHKVSYRNIQSCHPTVVLCRSIPAWSFLGGSSLNLVCRDMVVLVQDFVSQTGENIGSSDGFMVPSRSTATASCPLPSSQCSIAWGGGARRAVLPANPS